MDASLASTGIATLDDVLGGRLPRNRLFLVQGDPGADKTTFGLQFLLAGAANGEAGLYVALSETEAEIKSVAASHGWSLDRRLALRSLGVRPERQPRAGQLAIRLLRGRAARRARSGTAASYSLSSSTSREGKAP